MGLFTRFCRRGAEGAAQAATKSDLRSQLHARAEMPHHGAFAMETWLCFVSAASCTLHGFQRMLLAKFASSARCNRFQNRKSFASTFSL